MKGSHQHKHEHSHAHKHERKAIPTGMRTNIRMAIPTQSPATMSMDTQSIMGPMNIGI